MKRLMILFVLLFSSFLVKAYTSGIAISTSKSSVVQVFINGKLYNKSPSNFIRIRSTEGTFHLKVKILNLKTVPGKRLLRPCTLRRALNITFQLLNKKVKNQS